MKRLILLIAAVFALGFGAKAENDNYVADDAAIEQVFAAADEVMPTEMVSFMQQGIDMLGAVSGDYAHAQVTAKSGWAAWALCWIVGGFGIHRHYLGTSKPMWLYYTISCGGIFGIVPLVDWVVLLVGAIQGNTSEYENNDQFFMWG